MDWRLLLLIPAVWAILAWMAHRSVFIPMKHPAGDWQQANALGVEDVSLTSGGVRIHGWWKPAPGAQAAVLFLHGNAGNVSHRGRHIRAWQQAGASILVPDWRGYGKSEGSPSESGLYEDALAGYEFLRRSGFPPERILVHGESLGTVAAADVAARQPVAGLILEAPFPSARAVAQTLLPLLGPMLIWGYDLRSRLRQVRAPVLVIHGDRDEVIPFRLGRAVFDAANEPKEFWAVHGAGHNDLPETAGEDYPERLGRFLQMALESRAVRAAEAPGGSGAP
ncbi:MAG: alpha/beta hydrolase [Bryobacteraceae bacterium]|nr:alpha/beta hydrolase [Bryobacteraceae bacterium]